MIDTELSMNPSPPITTLPHKRVGVGAIFNQEEQILIARRKPEGMIGGLWEFPGGKLEPGETAIDCIRREIREELGIEIAVGVLLIEIEHTYPTFTLTLIVHWCQHVSGQPQPLASSEVRWVNILDLNNYQFPPANVEIIQAIHSRKA
jgi:mutator protein MutT